MSARESRIWNRVGKRHLPFDINWLCTVSRGVLVTSDRQLASLTFPLSRVIQCARVENRIRS
jgi:hypothetical protein